MKPKINLVVVGHKDHGKSTLIGRLLYDSKAIPETKLQGIRDELKESGTKEFEFAFIMDSLQEEREGGLTLDIMQTPFQSKTYSYTIIDCPGHKEFIKKMLTGASQADAAVLVVSADEGIEDQTKQHAFLIKTLGITQLVVAINKMDRLDYQQQRFSETRTKLVPILRSLGYQDVPILPISAMAGANVFKKSTEMQWYTGSSLIDTLDQTITPSIIPVNKPLRGFVQDIYKTASREIIVGKVETGILEMGKTLYFSPSGNEGHLEAIEEFGARIERAEPGDSVGLVVTGAETVERGEVFSYPENRPKTVKEFSAEIILLSNIEIKNGDVVKIRSGTAEKHCRIQQIMKEIDPINLTTKDRIPQKLTEGSVAEVNFLPLEPMSIEKYAEFPPLGRFVIEDEKGTAAAGLVLTFESK